MSNIFRNFKSLSEWISYAETDLPTDGNMFTRTSATPDISFAGVSTKEKAFEYFLMGYPDGLQRMREIVDALQRNIIMPTMTDHFECDVQGCAPNVEAYIQGMPEDMFVISQIQEDAPPSMLTVQLELCFSAYITPLQAMWAGATIFAAVEALRVQGCAITLLMTHTVRSHFTNSTWQSSAPIPSNIDMDSLSFLITHPSVLRVITFCNMEHELPPIREEFGFHSKGSYSGPHAIKSPLADVLIEMRYITQDLTAPTPDALLPQAQALLNRMIETKFGYTKNSDKPFTKTQEAI